VFDGLAKLIPNLGGYETYILAVLGIWAMFALSRRTGGQAIAPDAFVDAAMPLSLHPVIDPALCIGCGACTNACPEGKILSLIGGKAELIDAASCIGHGACKTSCPVNAIDLVFGTAKRGVDIPQVAPDFQSNIPGIYIAGELGGMGLIANAIEQGSQAIEAISKREGLHQPNILDVVIVGGGPAGFAASLAAKERQLRSVTLEQGTLGGTVAHYPRDKVVMTRPARLPLYGKFKARRVQKEKLLELWQSVMQKTRLQIRFGERVERVTPKPWGFEVETQNDRFATRTVLLATGRRGAPRKLGVPGEDLPKVVYGLVDADQYRGKHVLVVGGGNSAVEAALELARHAVAKVTISYRGDVFARVKPENIILLNAAEAESRVDVVRGSTVTMIETASVVLERGGQRRELKNDVVVVCAGGLLPMALLAQIGVAVETKYGTL
jgi:thioredoxin reductase (NADPH)